MTQFEDKEFDEFLTMAFERAGIPTYANDIKPVIKSFYRNKILKKVLEIHTEIKNMMPEALDDKEIKGAEIGELIGLTDNLSKRYAFAMAQSVILERFGINEDDHDQ